MALRGGLSLGSGALSGCARGNRHAVRGLCRSARAAMGRRRGGLCGVRPAGFLDDARPCRRLPSDGRRPSRDLDAVGSARPGGCPDRSRDLDVLTDVDQGLSPGGPGRALRRGLWTRRQPGSHHSRGRSCGRISFQDTVRRSAAGSKPGSGQGPVLTRGNFSCPRRRDDGGPSPV